MADPIFSPDGQFMWTGSEWIPAPPGSLNVKDSVVMGNITNIVNDSEAVSKAVKEANKCPICKSTGSAIMTCSKCDKIAFCPVCKDDVIKEREETLLPPLELTFDFQNCDDTSHGTNNSEYTELRLCGDCYDDVLNENFDSCPVCNRFQMRGKYFKSTPIKTCSVCGLRSCHHCNGFWNWNGNPASPYMPIFVKHQIPLPTRDNIASVCTSNNCHN